MLAVIRDLFSGTLNWNTILSIFTTGSYALVYLTLMGIIFLASLKTGGGLPFVGGGGHGAIMVFQTMAIGIFAVLFLLPNFATLGFPSSASGDQPVLEIINIVFGGMLAVALIGLFRGIE